MSGKTKEGRRTVAHYVAADIHGEADCFYVMLGKIQFSGADTIYILGDVVESVSSGIKFLQDIMKRPNMVMFLVYMST